MFWSTSLFPRPERERELKGGGGGGFKCLKLRAEEESWPDGWQPPPPCAEPMKQSVCGQRSTDIPFLMSWSLLSDCRVRNVDGTITDPTTKAPAKSQDTRNDPAPQRTRRKMQMDAQEMNPWDNWME